MPVPKDKRDLYAKVVGRQINLGKTLKEARAIADAAIKSKPKGKKK